MKRRNYLRIGLFVALIVIVIIVHFFVAQGQRFLSLYETFVFFPFQKWRSILLNKIPFSVGDFLYLIILILLVFFIGKTLFALIKFRNERQKITQSLLQLLITSVIVYGSFLVLWGANYNRPNITKHWTDSLAWDKTSLANLNEFLVKKINEEAVHFQNISLDSSNVLAKESYQKYLGSKYNYLFAKPSSLGNLLNYFGIQGYYNPLSGEAQINNNLPEFMHPFIVSHEMAHQTGIAAEDNANLMAYIICSQSENATFRYSGYFNIFLYANSDLKQEDSTLALQYFNELNSVTQEHINILRQLRKKYRSFFKVFTLGLYNQYLVWQGQDKGIDSYNDVVKWVYIWEHSEKKKVDIATYLSSNFVKTN